VEYPALPSTVDCGGVVGFILTLKGQVFSLILYKTPFSQTRLIRLGHILAAMKDGLIRGREDLPSSPEEAIAESESEPLYAPAEQVEDKTVRKTLDEREEDSDSIKHDELHQEIKALNEAMKHKFDTVGDVIGLTFLDVLPEDDLKPGSKYDLREMTAAWVYRLIAPSDGYSTVSWTDLSDRIRDDDDLGSLVDADHIG